jgi:hypothetical protein
VGSIKQLIIYLASARFTLQVLAHFAALRLLWAFRCNRGCRLSGRIFYSTMSSEFYINFKIFQNTIMITELIFKKNLQELTIDDLKSFFLSEQKESNVLEFKSIDSSDIQNQDNAIIKTLSAFLNTEGGILIWGSPKGHKLPNGEKVFTGDLTSSSQQIAEDRFMSRVASLITPTPSGINFRSIEDNQKFIYVIEVNKSNYPPHQFDSIYYMRFNATTIKAPHHYVEALMKQIKIPNLQGFLHSKLETIGMARFGVIPFALSLHNFSIYNPAFNVEYSLAVKNGDFFFEEENFHSLTQYIYHNYRIANRKVLDKFHYNVSIADKFFLIIPEQLSKTQNCELRLSFFSNECPIKISSYTYSISHTSTSFQPVLTELKKVENVYSFELSDKLGKTEEQKVKETGDILLEKLPLNFYQGNLITQLQ